MKQYKVLDHTKNALKADLNCPHLLVLSIKTRISGTKPNLTLFCPYREKS